MVIFISKKVKKRYRSKKDYGITGAIWIIKSEKLKKFKTFYCQSQVFPIVGTLQLI